ncbi:RNA polymerase sigma factor [Solidesulfovibrio alcoholivorans]|uniref:RNA polymerase sigma factor n=1 Tax=Solidesulfovibrio alcoholivorans TaxID=81406 RepID=UPI00138DDD8B|nr:sigma-70 family RNA polymerase sigma factor [Solidesulfovibrio alcoholivorans]
MEHNYDEMSSEDIMLYVSAGDKSALTVLIDRHKNSVFSCIYRFVRNKDETHDLAQEVFLRVWRFAHKYQPTSSFTTWLYTITANVCKTEVQSGWRRHIKLLGSFWPSADAANDTCPEPLDKAPSPEDAAIESERQRLVHAAIRSLSRKQRLALVLSRYEGLSYQEIATVLDCSVPAVESLLVRAKENLRKKLSPLRR